MDGNELGASRTASVHTAGEWDAPMNADGMKAQGMRPVQKRSRPTSSWLFGRFSRAQSKCVGLLRVGVATWNLGNAEPFATSQKDQISALFPLHKFDVFALGLQECRYDSAKAFDSLDDDDQDDDTADTQSPSRLKFMDLRSALDTSTKHIEALLCAHAEKGGMLLLKKVKLVQICLLVFVAKAMKPNVTGVSISREATGVASVYGNKGGVVVQLSLLNTRIAFVNCHLAAHQHQLTQRNDNVAEILRGTAVSQQFRKRFDVTLMCDHTFWFGDMNYRIHPDEKVLTTHEASFRHVVELIKQGKFSELYEFDQLRMEHDRGAVLSQFSIAQPTFAPTFKLVRPRTNVEDLTTTTSSNTNLVDENSANHDHKEITNKPSAEEILISNDVETNNMDYNSSRIPSWCDRVLWKSMPGLASHVSLCSFQSIPSITSSDHVPVLADFLLQLPGTEGSSKAESTFGVIFSEMWCENMPPPRKYTTTVSLLRRSSRKSATEKTDNESARQSGYMVEFSVYPFRTKHFKEFATRPNVYGDWKDQEVLVNARGDPQHNARVHVIMMVINKGPPSHLVGVSVVSLHDAVKNANNNDNTFEFALPVYNREVKTAHVLHGKGRVINFQAINVRRYSVPKRR